MKKLKRWISVLLSCMMFCGMFTGCGSSEAATMRVGAMKGPTSMGLLFLMEQAEAGECEDTYEFTMATAADELFPLMIEPTPKS